MFISVTFRCLHVLEKGVLVLAVLIEDSFAILLVNIGGLSLLCKSGLFLSKYFWTVCSGSDTQRLFVLDMLKETFEATIVDNASLGTSIQMRWAPHVPHIS